MGVPIVCVCVVFAVFIYVHTCSLDTYKIFDDFLNL